jgi:hypothetical protein
VFEDVAIEGLKLGLDRGLIPARNRCDRLGRPPGAGARHVAGPAQSGAAKQQIRQTGRLFFSRHVLEMAQADFRVAGVDRRRVGVLFKPARPV